MVLFVDDKPNIRFTPDSFARGAPTTLGDVFDASYRETLSGWNTDARARGLDAAFDRRIDEVYQATGQRLENPRRMSYERRQEVIAAAKTEDDLDEITERGFMKKLARLQESYPDAVRAIRPETSITQDAYDRAHEDERRLFDVRSRASTTSAVVGGLAGGLAAGIQDPVNLAVSAVTGLAGNAAKALLWNAGRAGAANAVAETALQPFIAEWRKEAGLEYGVSQFATNVGQALLVGGALDAGVRGTVRGLDATLRGGSGRAASIARAMSPREREAALQQAARRLPENNPIRRAYEGDSEAFIEIVAGQRDKLPASERGALAALEDDLAIRGLKPEGIDDGEHLRQAAEALRRVQDPTYAIKAWHGSADDFDRFSTNAIGTGEGAQAFGRGLYFTERPDLADMYKTKLVAKHGEDGSPMPYLRGRRIGASADDQATLTAAIAMKSNNGDHNEAVVGLIERRKYNEERLSRSGSLRQKLGLTRDYVNPSKVQLFKQEIANANKAIALLREMRSKRERFEWKKADGRRYDVTIDADDGDLVLFDRPFAEQPEKVRSVLSSKGGISPETWADVWDGDTASGSLPYRKRADLLNRDWVIEGLRSAGVKGVKYLDRQSRADGDGTYNYVVFDDADVSIDAKHAIRSLDDPAGPDAVKQVETLEAAAKERQGASADLDMSQDARMARAEAMGFDTSRVLYHGTTKDFAEFDVGKTDPNYAPAIYLAVNPETAALFARPDMAGARSINVWLRRGKYFDHNNSDEMNALAEFMRSRSVGDFDPSTRTGTVEKFIGWARKGDPQTLERPVIQKWLRSNGYDGWLAIEEESRTIGVFDPRNIRSVNARFDPAEEGSSSLLAAVAPEPPKPKLTPERMDALWFEVEKVIDRLPKGTRVRLKQRLVARMGGATVELFGSFEPRERLIWASLADGETATALRHEEIHLLREAGLFSDHEWKTLSDHVRKEGLTKRAGPDGKPIDETYRKAHANRSPEQIEDLLIEEAVAHLWAGYKKGERYGAAIDGLIATAQRILRQVREAIGLNGARSLDDVFDAIGTGEVGRRGAAGRRGADVDPLFAIRGPDDAAGEIAAADGAVSAAGVMRGAAADTPSIDAGAARQAEKEVRDRRLRRRPDETIDEYMMRRLLGDLEGVTKPLSAEEKAEIGERYRELLAEKLRIEESLERTRQVVDGPTEAEAVIADQEAREILADELEKEALQRKRVALLTTAIQGKHDEALGKYLNAAGERDAAEYLMRVLEHHGVARGGIESSVEGRRKAIVGRAHSGMEEMLWEFRRTAVSGRRMNTARLENVVRQAFGENSGDLAAAGLARAWGDTAEELRQRFNAAGGSIGLRKDWGLPQWHDARALRNAGLQTWKRAITPLLDPQRMIHPLTGQAMGAAELSRSLDHVFETIVSEGWNTRIPGTASGRGALYRQRADHRFLVFRNANSWMAYNRDFGHGGTDGIFAAMMGHINLMARDIAAMEILGPNPNAMLTYLQQVVEREASLQLAGRPAAIPLRSPATGLQIDPVDYARGAVKRSREMWAHMRGAAGTPVGSTAASLLAGLRNFVTATTLGGAALSSLSDVGYQAMARRFAGLDTGRRVASDVRTIVDVIRQMRTMDRRDAVRSGLIMESAVNVLHDQARYVGTLNGPMWTQFAADRILTLSGLTPWTTAGRHAFGFEFMGAVADQAGNAWAGVTPALRETFGRYGMGEADWERLRFATVRDRLLRPDAVDQIDRVLADRYLEMILQETEYAVPSGTVRGRSMVIGENQPGTLIGEALRSATQFKNFGVTITLLQGGRIAQQLGQGRRMAAAQYAASLLITSAFYGAFIIQTRELSRGKDLRPMDDPDFWGASMLQAGGLGIYGDFLFGDINRFGGGLSTTLAGPVVGRFQNIWNLTGGNVVQFGQGEPTNFGKEAVTFARQNTPGGSIWYLRLAYERMVLDNLQKLVDPKAHQAFRQKVRTQKKQFGNDFWWAPGTAAPQRAPALSAP